MVLATMCSACPCAVAGIFRDAPVWNIAWWSALHIIRVNYWAAWRAGDQLWEPVPDARGRAGDAGAAPAAHPGAAPLACLPLAERAEQRCQHVHQVMPQRGHQSLGALARHREQLEGIGAMLQVLRTAIGGACHVA